MESSWYMGMWAGLGWNVRALEQQRPVHPGLTQDLPGFYPQFTQNPALSAANSQEFAIAGNINLLEHILSYSLKVLYYVPVMLNKIVN